MILALTDFYLNGRLYRVDTGQNSSLQDILQYFNYQKTVFIIEHNSTISSKNEWKSLKIKNNDVIEIITIVGGG